MTIRVPSFPEVPGLFEFLTAQFEQAERQHNDFVSKRTANHSLLLQSSGDKVYEVTIDDAGALVITLVAG